MSKQVFSRDEVKTLLREAINKKQNAATEPVEDKPEAKPDENQKTYTREEVVALIKEDRKRTSKS